MKVTRQHRGYMIRCTDAQFAVLEVAMVLLEQVECPSALVPVVVKRGAPFLRVDKDVRNP